MAQPGPGKQAAPYTLYGYGPRGLKVRRSARARAQRRAAAAGSCAAAGGLGGHAGSTGLKRCLCCLCCTGTARLVLHGTRAELEARPPCLPLAQVELVAAFAGVELTKAPFTMGVTNKTPWYTKVGGCRGRWGGRRAASKQGRQCSLACCHPLLTTVPRSRTPPHVRGCCVRACTQMSPIACTV